MFVTGLEYATDRKAEVVGKPEERFFMGALRDLNCDPTNSVMIGDVCGSFSVLEIFRNKPQSVVNRAPKYF